jgi:hypothetical protein
VISDGSSPACGIFWFQLPLRQCAGYLLLLGFLLLQSRPRFPRSLPTRCQDWLAVSSFAFSPPLPVHSFPMRSMVLGFWFSFLRRRPDFVYSMPVVASSVSHCRPDVFLLRATKFSYFSCPLFLVLPSPVGRLSQLSTVLRLNFCNLIVWSNRNIICL